MVAQSSVAENVIFCRSNPVAPDPRVEKAARVLSKVGYTITIVGWDRSGELPLIEKKDYATVVRVRIKAAYATGLANLPSLIHWELSLLGWLLFHYKEYQLIHSCDFDTILPALTMKWLFGKKVVYDIFDFYADHLRKTPTWIKSVIKRIDKWAIHKADAIILADDARLNQIEGAKPKRCVVIYNTPEDIGVLSPKESLEIQAHMKIAYVGLLQIERGLLDLLSVLEEHPDWHLFLAGFGGDQQAILEKAEKLPNVHWHGRIRYEDAITLTAQCDVMIALYDPKIPNHRYASPNKLFEAMMLAKPIIVAEGTNIDQIVNQFRCGIVVSYGNLKQLEDALSTVANQATLRMEMGLNGRWAYEKYYSWNEMSERLRHLYSEL